MSSYVIPVMVNAALASLSLAESGILAVKAWMPNVTKTGKLTEKLVTLFSVKVPGKRDYTGNTTEDAIIGLRALMAMPVEQLVNISKGKDKTDGLVLTIKDKLTGPAAAVFFCVYSHSPLPEFIPSELVVETLADAKWDVDSINAVLTANKRETVKDNSRNGSMANA